MSLNIIFDRPSEVFSCNESVAGHLIVLLTEPLTVNGVRLTIMGHAHVEWTETQSSTPGSGLHHSQQYQQQGQQPHYYTEYYKADQDFLLTTITVWGNPHGASFGSPTPIMPAGRHVFAFSFPLSGNLPGTFRGEHGNIEYTINAHVDRPAFRFDIKTSRSFIVMPVLLLNLLPEAILPREVHDGKDICCWCCFAGRVGVMIAYPKSGYANNEVIAVRADIINHSRKTVTKVIMTLRQIVRYTATDARYGYTVGSGHSRDSYQMMAVWVRDDPIKPGVTKQWVNEGLRVPPIAQAYPTMGANMCKIINVSYDVLFEIHISGCTMNLRVLTPVIIGTVPVGVALPPPL